MLPISREEDGSFTGIPFHLKDNPSIHRCLEIDLLSGHHRQASGRRERHQAVGESLLIARIDLLRDRSADLARVVFVLDSFDHDHCNAIFGKDGSCAACSISIPALVLHFLLGLMEGSEHAGESIAPLSSREPLFSRSELFNGSPLPEPRAIAIPKDLLRMQVRYPYDSSEMKLLSISFPGILLAGGAIATSSALGTPVIQGALEAAVGNVLAGPAAWLGEGLVKMRIKREAVPQVVSALTTLAAWGVGKGFGVNEDLQLSIIRIGAQAGMTSGFAHDAGWTNPKQWGKDVAGATGAKQMVEQIAQSRKEGK